MPAASFAPSRRARRDQLVERLARRARRRARAALPRRAAASAITPGQRSTSATRSGGACGKRLRAPRRRARAGARAPRRSSAARCRAGRLRRGKRGSRPCRARRARAISSRSSGSSARSSSATRNCRSRKRALTERSSSASRAARRIRRRGGVAGHAVDHVVIIGAQMRVCKPIKRSAAGTRLEKLPHRARCSAPGGFSIVYLAHDENGQRRSRSRNTCRRRWRCARDDAPVASKVRVAEADLRQASATA